MTTYTVFDPDASIIPIARHVSAISAMDAILTDDGRLYEVTQDDDGAWSLWVSRFSVASSGGAGPMRRANVPRSYAATQMDAEEEIAAHVVSANWPGIPKAMADDDYDAMMAQLEIENQED